MCNVIRCYDNETNWKFYLPIYKLCGCADNVREYICSAARCKTTTSIHVIVCVVTKTEGGGGGVELEKSWGGGRAPPCPPGCDGPA